MKTRDTSDRISDAGVDIFQIAETSVLLKVGDISAQCVRQHPVYALCRGLGALGFDSIHLCGAVEYFDVMAEVMDGCNFVQHPGIWLAEEMAMEMAPEDVDLIIDLTNEIGFRSFCQDLAVVRACPCIYVMWGPSWVAVNFSPIMETELGELAAATEIEQNTFPPIARIACGLALQEALALAGQVDLVAPLEKTVIYNVAADDRVSRLTESFWTSGRIEDVTLEVVGAGGIGVHLLESLAPVLGHGCEVRLFDPDEVGVENIPLQTPYTSADVDRPKAIVISEKLRQICHPDVAIRPMVMGYEQRPLDLQEPTVRITCPDTWAVRKYANDLSIVDGIPLLDAGSFPLAAQQRSYYPGLTACLSHRIRDLAGKSAREQEPNSCSANPALTLPGTNMVIGGILAAETLKALQPERFGLPSRGTITYDARAPQRFAVVDIRSPCQHSGTRSQPSKTGLNIT